MLKGDLSSTPLAPLLLELAGDAVTGCLHIVDPAGDEAQLYLKGGLVYAVTVPGRRPQLGAKLVSSGAVAPEALADALEAQRTELLGWRLGELLVHLGYVDQPVVEAFVREQLHDALWDLMRWTQGEWRFRKNVKTREDVAPPMPVTALLTVLRERGFEWENISLVVHGPAAVPVLSARSGADAQTTLDNDAWTMLCKIDGERTVADLARDGGYTMFEAGLVIVQLVRAGLVDIEEDVDVIGDGGYDAPAAPDEIDGDVDDDTSGDAVGDADDAVARLARLVSEVAGTTDVPTQSTGSPDLAPAPADAESPIGVNGWELTPGERSIVPLQPTSSESFAASIARVSAALSDVLGPVPTESDGDIHGSDLRARHVRETAAQRRSDPDWERHERLRAGAAAELAAAHALAEALRPKQEAGQIEARRRAVEAAALAEVEQVEAEWAAVDAAERREAEQVEQVERLEAEAAAQLEAEKVDAERLEAERLEAERLEAERLEAERVAAEQAREAAERLAAEEAARAEVERLAAEAAAQAEAERIEAEQAAREAAERIAAEAAAQAEAERAEAERIDAARIAAEQAAREAAEEAARAEAERLAVEAAAKADAERLEAETAARIEAERHVVERLAAEANARLEAESLAAEAAAQLDAERAEAERLAAEQAVAAQAVAAQVEAEQAEAVRVAAEAAEAAAEAAADTEAQAAPVDTQQTDANAAREAAAEADRRDDAAAAATALLVELSAEPVHNKPVHHEPDPDAADATEPADAPDAGDADVDDDDRVPVGSAPAINEGADTAALLRELSSLGVDDDRPAPSQTPMQRAPNRGGGVSSKQQKKKRGLFGL